MARPAVPPEMLSAQPVLTVRSVDEAMGWYGELLGFEPSFVNRDRAGAASYAVLRNGGAGLHLGLERDMQLAAGQGSCNLVTRDFDLLLQRAREAGARFFIEPGTIPSGARTFGIEDPDGNRVTFVEAS